MLKDCHNDLNIYDMIGNLEEWVLDDFNGRAGSLEGGILHLQRICRLQWTILTTTGLQTDD